MSYCCLSRIVQTEEEEFGVLVGQAKLRQDIPDCALISASVFDRIPDRGFADVHQSMIHMLLW